MWSWRTIGEMCQNSDYFKNCRTNNTACELKERNSNNVVEIRFLPPKIWSASPSEPHRSPAARWPVCRQCVRACCDSGDPARPAEVPSTASLAMDDKQSTAGQSSPMFRLKVKATERCRMNDLLEGCKVEIDGETFLLQEGPFHTGDVDHVFLENDPANYDPQNMSSSLPCSKEKEDGERSDRLTKLAGNFCWSTSLRKLD